MPDYTETEIETYSAEELGQLFGACSAAERLVFQFFLGTGHFSAGASRRLKASSSESMYSSFAV
jgi:hypothetical protein